MKNKNSIPALEIHDLNHFYAKFQALNEIELTIQQGEFVILLGANGAGKTTLFSLVTRLYNNRYGSIKINDFELTKFPTKALRYLGVVFQQRSLDIDLTVEQNLKYSAALHGMSKRLANERTHEELERLNMLEYSDQKIRKLSGGQARRVEIARALMSRPKILILDEPTVGLDVNSREQIIQHVRELCSQNNIAVLWTTHLMDEIQADDTVVILKKGNIAKKGRAEKIAGAKDFESMKKSFQALLE